MTPPPITALVALHAERARRAELPTDCVECQCRTCHGRLFGCERCGRAVPWCFGGDDDLCDDCYAAAPEAWHHVQHWPMPR